MIHASILVSGKVQGVFYRAKEKADSLGLKGWVMNRDDGKVELLAEGDEEKIYKFLKWCNRGSTLSQVDSVEVTKKKIDDSSSDTFLIR